MKVYLLNNFHKFHNYPSSKCFQHKQPLVCIYHKNTREYFQIYQCLILSRIILFVCGFLSRALLNHRVRTCTVAALQSQTSIYYQKFHFLQSHYFHLLKHCLQVQAFIHFFDETFTGFIFKIYCELFEFQTRCGWRYGGGDKISDKF